MTKEHQWHDYTKQKSTHKPLSKHSNEIEQEDHESTDKINTWDSRIQEALDDQAQAVQQTSHQEAQTSNHHPGFIGVKV